MKMTKFLSEYYSDNNHKKAVVGYSRDNECYYIDFYENDTYLCSRWYSHKSQRYVEDAAENYVQDILNFKDWIYGVRENYIQQSNSQ